MGACGSGTKHNAQRKRRVRCDIEPSDTQSLKDRNLPILAFYVLLSDIKIKKCQMEHISLRFRINGVEEYNCIGKEPDQQHRAYWRINHSFDFMMNQYELRKKFLVVEAINKKKEVIGMLKFNMYTMWIGPFHLDFLLELNNYNPCRISFNFRISQGVHLRLENNETEFVPLQTKIEGTRLTFTMEAIMGQKTDPSNYVFHVCVQQKQAESRGLMGKFPAAKAVRKDCIKWIHKPQLQKPLPRFNQKIAFYQLYSSSVHINFWRVLPGLVDPMEPRYQSQGQCFLPLSKLMGLDYTIQKDPVTNIEYLHRNIDLEEKVWLNGKEMGLAKLKITFILQAHQKQMQSCVRSQEGILTSTPVFFDATSTQKCQQIIQLSQINTNIQKQFINLDQLAQQTHSRNYVALKDIISRLYNLLQQQLALLQKTNKESILIYNYPNETELMKGERILIDFAFKVIQYIHQDIAELNQLCWLILTSILKRGEFKLSHMGFSKAEKEEIDQKKHSKQLQHKIDVGLKYMELLNSLLKETLRSLEVKGETAQQVFAQKFCAYAYFRIPLFRQHILQTIKEGHDPQIPQWRGIQNNLYSESHHENQTNDYFYQNLFDWQHNFYKPLSTEDRYKSLRMALQTTLMEDRWKLRLAQRRGVFYTFLENLVKEIQYVSVVSKYIKWFYLPGYTRLLHAFLAQMKKIKIRNYTQRFKRCSIQLLSNQKLLNVMVVLLLKRSNVNDPETVAIAFEMLDQFFKAIKRNKRPIPTTFDYKYLLMGMKIVLESEFQMSISQVLLFIYDNFAVFSQQFSLQVSLYLMTRLFYRFFFHWSFNLRSVFHMLVAGKITQFEQTRIYRDSYGRGSKEVIETGYIAGLKLALRQRHQSLLVTIKQDIQPKAPSANIDSFYDKDLYKKMKARLGKIKIQHKKQPSVNQEYNFLQLQSFSSSKSMGQDIKYIPPKKLMYFRDEELVLSQIQPEQMGYVKLVLTEYKKAVQNLKKQQDTDPDFTPDMSFNKITDEVQLNSAQHEEW